VTRIVKQIVIAALFAVAMLGGSELPILHAPQFAAAHAFVHEHMHEVAPDADAKNVQLAGADHDRTLPPGQDHGCTHVHAHCCAATAILVSAVGAAPTTDCRQMRFERNGAVPYGQLSSPPLRPPRAA